jgi:hypothetical protein
MSLFRCGCCPGVAPGSDRYARRVSYSVDAEDFVIDEWHAALHDAGVAENDFHLITCPGAAVTGHAKAAYFAKGDILCGDEEEGGIVVHPDKLAEANDAANLSRHRVAVYEDVDGEDEVGAAYLAGVLRHEIEHGKQRDATPEAFGLSDIVDVVCHNVAAGDSVRYRDLVNASPIEADANAAASAHVCKRYPAAVDALRAGFDHYLADATTGPGDPTTLVERTVDYLWQFGDICNDPTNLPSDGTFADILDNRVPDGGAGKRWRGLQEAESR